MYCNGIVWSELMKGDSAYTLIQVATNDIIILFAYVPIVTCLLGISNISIPYDTLILSIILICCNSIHSKYNK